jgi:hypothetical protein
MDNIIQTLRNGTGKCVFNDGSIYQGETRVDRLEGKGKMIFGKDSKTRAGVYIGEFKNDLIEGKGIYKHSNGDVYEGDFKNDNKEGKGKYKLENGDVCEGDLKNDTMEGKGIMRFANGDVYEGDFKNGVFEGKGKFIYSKDGKGAGYIYEGDWKNGNQYGIVIHTFPNGRKEKREYENDKLKRVIEVLEEGKV